MKTSDATKETLISSLASAKEKLKIRGVKKIANNGVLVEIATKEDLERVLKSKNLQAAGFVTGLPAKKKPRIIVYDVPICINCKRAAKPCDHSSRLSECSAYKFALSNLISKIDYGCQDHK
ncbi:hypothetical protein K0M31_012043 [Melipona bicolor]|uniref:Uncharacterized protein n=1 Tax=Melipona bicolor TaxID=60889 RepID=A0AA40GBH1_9HYME|nr:hypothetical protein K0M31_012043 [Melipona bicolor]